MNPTGQPMGTPMPSAPAGAALEAVKLPSLFIIILAAGGALLFLLVGLNQMVGGSAQMMEQALANMPEDQRQQLAPLLAMQRGGGGAFGPILGVLMCGFTAWGGMQMRNLKNWGVALASAILVMLPCGSYCCCCLGIPAGIWALVMLTKPEVKAAFS